MLAPGNAWFEASANLFTFCFNVCNSLSEPSELPTLTAESPNFLSASAAAFKFPATFVKLDKPEFNA